MLLFKKKSSHKLPVCTANCNTTNAFRERLYENVAIIAIRTITIIPFHLRPWQQPFCLWEWQCGAGISNVAWVTPFTLGCSLLKSPLSRPLNCYFHLTFSSPSLKSLTFAVMGCYDALKIQWMRPIIHFHIVQFIILMSLAYLLNHINVGYFSSDTAEWISTNRHQTSANWSGSVRRALCAQGQWQYRRATTAGLPLSMNNSGLSSPGGFWEQRLMTVKSASVFTLHSICITDGPYHGQRLRIVST